MSGNHCIIKIEIWLKMVNKCKTQFLFLWFVNTPIIESTLKKNTFSLNIIVVNYIENIPTITNSCIKLSLNRHLLISSYSLFVILWWYLWKNFNFYLSKYQQIKILVTFIVYFDFFYNCGILNLVMKYYFWKYGYFRNVIT